MQHPLIWKKFPILNDGFICLSDFMGNDAKIASRARTSYGKDDRTNQSLQAEYDAISRHYGNEISEIRCNHQDGYTIICFKNDLVQNKVLNHIQDNDELMLLKHLTQKAKDSFNQKDTDLIRRLMRDRHTSPFEFCTVEFLVRAPIYVFRQWHRHRTASINEYSGRYKEMIDSMETTPPGKWRLQSGKNKQGSDGYLSGSIDQLTVQDVKDLLVYSELHSEEEFPFSKDQASEVLTKQESTLHKLCSKVYKLRLALGVAKEQARKDLPVSNYSEMYWSCNLHNLLHFLTLRMDSHAQEEIRLYANQIGEIVKELFPITWQAFEDYRLNAMTLTALDIKVMQKWKSSFERSLDDILNNVFTNKTEREECVTKLKRLGIL